MAPPAEYYLKLHIGELAAALAIAQAEKAALLEKLEALEAPAKKSRAKVTPIKTGT